jgi:hypothetical protein
VADGTQAAAITVCSEIKLCNSYGLDLSRSAGANVVYSVPVIKDGEESQEAFKMELYDGKNDLEQLAKDAVCKAIEKMGATTVKSGKYNVVIEAKQMRTMLSAFFPAFSAKQAQSGMSLLSGKEGEKIASDVVTITDDPMREGNPFITNFDAEGVAARRKTVVDKGVLKTLLYNLETAKKAGVEKYVKAAIGDVRDFKAPEKRCLTITNPPYGERLLDVKAAEELYKVMGKQFEQGEGRKYFIISPHDEFEKHYGKEADKRRKLYNGMIKCQLFMYFK